MAAYGWRKDPSVEEGLFSEAHRFDFYQAVKLLEMLYPEGDPPGEGVEPRTQTVRFRSNVRLDFAASDVDSLAPPAGGDPALMTVNFMGLAGAMGPLPRSFTELLLERKTRERAAGKTTALQDFLDIFNHRLIAMLYRARKKYRPALVWERPSESRISRPFFALVGLGTPKLERRMNVEDRSLLLYAGMLSRVARTMVGGARMLRHYFGVPVELEPFEGRWLELSGDQLTRIGSASRGRNQALGASAVLGTRFWDQQAGFELRIGPLSFERFLDFLPIGSAFGQLCALTEFYAGHEMFSRVRLTLEAAEVPELRLGAEGGARLGWTTWLKTRPATEDDSQVVLRKSGTSAAGSAAIGEIAA